MVDIVGIFFVEFAIATAELLVFQILEVIIACIVGIVSSTVAIVCIVAVV